MRFRLQGQGLADSAAKIGQTLAMLPMMREQWAQEAQQQQAKNALTSAQTQNYQSQADLNAQKIKESQAGMDALRFEPRFTNAAHAYGVSPADVPDFLKFAQTKQMPGQYVQPDAELGGGPALPAPAMYGDDTLSKVLRMAAMTGNAATLGDRNSSNITENLGRMQGQAIIEQALQAANSGNTSKVNLLGAARTGNAYMPFTNVGNTGGSLNKATGAQTVADQGLRVLFGNEVNSKVNENNAQAGAAKASASASSALAGLRGVQTGNAKIQGGILAQDFADVTEGRAPTSKARPTAGADSTNAKTRNAVIAEVEKSMQGASDEEINAEISRRLSRRDIKTPVSGAPPQPPKIEDAPANTAQRKAGTIYNTPRGALKWTGTGWLPAN